MRSANTLPFILQEIAIIPTYDLRRTTYAGRMQQPIPYVCLETVPRANTKAGHFMSSCLHRPQTTTYGMLHHRCIRPACVEIIAIFWSIKESDFARFMSFASSSHRERISSSGPLGKEMVDCRWCRWRWEMVFIM